MNAISSNELRELYQRFFEGKQHARIPSAPLTPEHDPSVLFTTAGMHPLVPYLKGQPHPAGKRLTNVQKCLRTKDIEAVGDATHATVFEMLGNWSLGDYFKEEAIAYSWEFLTSPDWLGIDPQYLAVSAFAGDDDAPRDEESARIWQSAGVPAARIAYLGKQDNWWPAGGGAPGPQGPDTEMFYWVGSEQPPREFDPEDKNWVEIWNDVFMQYNRTESGEYMPLPQQNVDTGMGLERTVMVLNGLTSIYDIDTYIPLMRLIAQQATRIREADAVRHARIVADHIKAALFVLADEQPTAPSKSEQGYVLRRLIRRAVRSARVLGVKDSAGLLARGAEIVAEQYAPAYATLPAGLAAAQAALRGEVEKFERVLTGGLKQFEQLLARELPGDVLSGADAFHLYETYGFPVELTEEMAREHGLGLDLTGFEEALTEHQDTSRTAAAGKFKGGLADTSEMSVKYHTATHLLHQALRDVLGEHVVQKGSNITPERLRFDFSHGEKMTDEQRSRVEDIVNENIVKNLPVQRQEMTVAEAKAAGALGLFEERYGKQVSMYSIGDYSREICGGPHVRRTGELGRFRIAKEESAGTGIRRIKATLL